VFAEVHGNFDRVLLSERSAWFADRSRDDVFRGVAERALDCEPRAWGEVQRFMMKHLLLGDRLPAALGFDRGPVTAKGSRATIHVSQIYKLNGRETSFVPSYRFVTDMADNTLHTTLAGGPSDRRFSRWYASDVDDWLAGNYKNLTADPDQPKLPFKYRDVGPPRLADLGAFAKRVHVDLGRLLGRPSVRGEVAG
jgi:penicillin amidase